MERYYPTGYIGTDAAILRIAKARSPSLWSQPAMSEKEAAVWSRMNIAFCGGDLERNLWTIPPHERTGTYERFGRFGEALTELRKALHRGSISAEYLDRDGNFNAITPSVWGAGNAVYILADGIVAIQTPPGVHVVLLREDQLASFIGESGVSLAAAGESGEPGAPELRGAEQLRSVDANRPSRRRGAVSLQTVDKPLVEEMHDLLRSGKAPSINAAAGMVLRRAVGHCTEDSKLRRLRSRYKEIYPS